MSQESYISFRRRIMIVAGAITIAIVSLVAAIALLAQSNLALEWATNKISIMSNGHLSIVGARGSLAGTLAIDRIVYKDSTIEVEGRDINFDWKPSALLIRQISVATLTAREVDVRMIPSATGSGETALPDSMALPIKVNVKHFGIDRLTLRSSESDQVFLGIQFGFTGDAKRHRYFNLAFSSDFGSVGGEIDLSVTKPYELDGALDWTLGEAASRVFVHAALGGTLSRINGKLIGGVGALALSGTAVAAPFADSWLPELTLEARDADLANVVATLPKTALSGNLVAGTDRHGRLAGTLNLTNASAGTWTDMRLPLITISTRIAVDGEGLQFDQLKAGLGAGSIITGRGRIAGSATELDMAVANLDLRAIHKPLRTTKLNGRIKATLAKGRQNFDVTLEERRLKIAASGMMEGEHVKLRSLTANAGKGALEASGDLSLTGGEPFRLKVSFARFDPSEFGNFPPANISGTADLSGQLVPEWHTAASITIKGSTFRGSPLMGTGTFKINARELRDANFDVSIGANRLHGQGSIGKIGDTLEFAFDGRRLAQLGPRVTGNLTVSAKFVGLLTHPRVAFEAKSDALSFDQRFSAGILEARGSWSNDDDPRIELKTTGQRISMGDIKLDSLTVDVGGSLALHTIALNAVGTGGVITTQWEGGVRKKNVVADIGDRHWVGHIKTLTSRGTLPFELLSPAPLEAGPGYFALGETSADLAGGRLSLRTLRRENGRITSSGGFTGVPALPILALAGVAPQPGSDLKLRGAWAINATPRLNGTLSVARESGDLIVLPNSTTRVGLEELNLDLRFVDDTANAKLIVQGSQFGIGKIDVTAVPAEGDGPLSATARLAGNVKLDLANLHLLDNWIGTAALVDGVVRAQLGLAGTLAAPVVTGTMEGDRIRFEVPQQGIALKNGRLRAELTDQALVVQEFSISGPTGTLAANGTLARRSDDGESQIEWRAIDLQLLDRPDQRLSVAGNGTIGMSKDRIVLRGALKALKGTIEFVRPHTTPLGDDVVVIGRKPKSEKTRRRATPLDLDATLDFGEHFKLSGAGLETGLQGKLRVHTGADGALLGEGKLRAVNGSYFAFGQKLSIERGQLYFDGPLTNPGLEIVAVRKNLPVEAGVEVTGTVRSPRVQLTSNPPVPDGEKLSWLVTGRGLDSASATDFGLLQAAAGSLINSNQSIPQTHLIARKIGLDDIGVRASGTGASNGATGGEALAIGKNLSDKIYLEYEKGLDVASNVLRLNYQLSRAFSLRVESGVDSAIGVFFRRSYD